MSLPSVQLDTDDLAPGPWIYARQVKAPSPELEGGSLVEVIDRSRRFVGHGLYNPASDIRVRFLSRGRRADLVRPREFLLKRLRSADRIRRKLLRLPEVTDAYRIVHAEGDDLSGLIVDKLGDVLVCEHHALGFWRMRDEVEWALQQIYPHSQVLHRIPKSARKYEDFPEAGPDGAGSGTGADEAGGGTGAGDSAPGDSPERWIREHGVDYLVAPGRDHKTGWFCDQRDNRLRVAQLCQGRSVLDLCCNAGGFSLQAARAGAARVNAIDLDEKVLARARASAERARADVVFHHADAFHYLRELRSGSSRAQVMVVDPHKFVGSKARLREGLKSYLDLNGLALEVVAPGGILATFSCSGALDLPGFLGVLFQASRRARRGVRLLEVLGAAPDHPQRPEFAKSRYLKGALLAVD